MTENKELEMVTSSWLLDEDQSMFSPSSAPAHMVTFLSSIPSISCLPVVLLHIIGGYSVSQVNHLLCIGHNGRVIHVMRVSSFANLSFVPIPPNVIVGTNNDAKTKTPPTPSTVRAVDWRIMTTPPSWSPSYVHTALLHERYIVAVTRSGMHLFDLIDMKWSRVFVIDGLHNGTILASTVINDQWHVLSNRYNKHGVSEITYHTIPIEPWDQWMLADDASYPLSSPLLHASVPNPPNLYNDALVYGHDDHWYACCRRANEGHATDQCHRLVRSSLPPTSSPTKVIDHMKWEAIASLHVPRRGGACVAIPGGILISGGTHDTDETYATVGATMEVFLFATQQWHQLAISLPTPLAWHRMEVMTTVPHLVVWSGQIRRPGENVHRSHLEMWALPIATLMKYIVGLNNSNTPSTPLSSPSSSSSSTSSLGTMEWIELQMTPGSSTIGSLVF
jgi:hypothetical protein